VTGKGGGTVRCSGRRVIEASLRNRVVVELALRDLLVVDRLELLVAEAPTELELMPAVDPGKVLIEI